MSIYTGFDSASSGIEVYESMLDIVIWSMGSEVGAFPKPLRDNFGHKALLLRKQGSFTILTQCFDTDGPISKPHTHKFRFHFRYPGVSIGPNHWPEISTLAIATTKHRGDTFNFINQKYFTKDFLFNGNWPISLEIENRLRTPNGNESVLTVKSS